MVPEQGYMPRPLSKTALHSSSHAIPLFATRKSTPSFLATSSNESSAHPPSLLLAGGKHSSPGTKPTVNSHLFCFGSCDPPRSAAQKTAGDAG